MRNKSGAHPNKGTRLCAIDGCRDRAMVKYCWMHGRSKIDIPKREDRKLTFTLACFYCSYRRDFYMPQKQRDLVVASGKLRCNRCGGRTVTLELEPTNSMRLLAQGVRDLR